MFVIDDDAGVRASIRGLLKSAGLRSEGFETAERFLQKEPAEGPSCLILDVSLPGMNGLEFQQRLRNAGIHVPVIFLTAYGDIPMTVNAMKAGAVDFLTKPFDDEELLDAIQQALACPRTAPRQPCRSPSVPAATIQLLAMQGMSR